MFWHNCVVNKHGYEKLKCLDLPLPADICIIWFSPPSFYWCLVGNGGCWSLTIDSHPRKYPSNPQQPYHQWVFSNSARSIPYVETRRKPTPKISCAWSLSFSTVAVGDVGILALRPPRQVIWKTHGPMVIPPSNRDLQSDKGDFQYYPTMVGFQKYGLISLAASDWDSHIWVEWPLVSQVVRGPERVICMESR